MPSKTRKRSPVLTEASQKLMARLQEQMRMPVLVYWTSTGGSICQNDVMAMARLLATRTVLHPLARTFHGP
jgi:hypothetical protein